MTKYFSRKVDEDTGSYFYKWSAPHGYKVMKLDYLQQAIFIEELLIEAGYEIVGYNSKEWKN